MTEHVWAPPGLGHQAIAAQEVLKLFPGRDQSRLESGWSLYMCLEWQLLVLYTRVQLLSAKRSLPYSGQTNLGVTIWFPAAQGQSGPAGLPLSSDTPLASGQRPKFHLIAGSLQNFATLTRPDLSCTGAALAIGMATPTGMYLSGGSARHRVPGGHKPPDFNI
jgi:hypothetical protein